MTGACADERREIRNAFQQIGDRHAESVAIAWQAGEFPRSLWDDLGDAGLFRFASSQGRGTIEGLPYLASALQGLTYATMDGGFAISVIVHAVLGIGMIEACAPESVRDQYIEDLASGKKILAFAVTEAHSGTDAFNPRTEVLQSGEGTYRLTGSKWHITNAPFADVLLLLARNTGTGGLVEVLVDRKSAGVSVSNPFEISGARTSPVAEIVFQDVTVPESHVFKPLLNGNNQMLPVLNREKVVGACASAGIMERVISDALTFTRRRKVDGKALAAHQHVQRRLTDLQLAMETTRGLSEYALAKLVAGEEITLEAAALKLHMGGSAFRAATDAILAMGSYGLLQKSRMPMALMDALAVTIGGGTEEAQRNIMMAEMVKLSRRA